MNIGKVVNSNFFSKAIKAAAVVTGAATTVVATKMIADKFDKKAEMLGRSQVKHNEICGTGTLSGKNITAKYVDGHIEGKIDSVKYYASDLFEGGMMLMTFDKYGNKVADVRFNKDGKVKFCDTVNKQGEWVLTRPMYDTAEKDND